MPAKVPIPPGVRPLNISNKQVRGGRPGSAGPRVGQRRHARRSLARLAAAPRPPPLPRSRARAQMDKYGLKTGAGRRDVVAYKLFNREEMIEEVLKMGFYSAWNDIRKDVEAYPEPEMMVVADLDEAYGENWWVALTPAAKDAYFEQFRAAERAEAAAAAAAEAEAKRRADEEAALEAVVVVDAPRAARPDASPSADETDRAVRALTVRRSRPTADDAKPRTRPAGARRALQHAARAKS